MVLGVANIWAGGGLRAQGRKKRGVVYLWRIQAKEEVGLWLWWQEWEREVTDAIGGKRKENHGKSV